MNKGREVVRARVGDVGWSLWYVAGLVPFYLVLGLVMALFGTIMGLVYDLSTLAWTVRWNVLADVPVLLGIAAVAALPFVVLAPLLLYAVRGVAGREIRRTGHYLRRRLQPLAPLVGKGRIRGVLRTASTWRAVGWYVVQTWVGSVLVLLALAPFVLLFDVFFLSYETNDGSGRHVVNLIGYVGAIVIGAPDPVNASWFGSSEGAVIVELAAIVPLLLFVTPLSVKWHAQLTARLLEGSRVSELEGRVDVLAQTRAGALDAHTAELRRIERDLHDGMQAQLVNVTMRLGMAERRLVQDPNVAGELLREARAGTEDAMTDLRTILRTMYPPVLADRGLDGALTGLAGKCTIPTTVVIQELGDLPAPVEGAAYFVVSEALTNATKHSDSSWADVRVHRETGRLVVKVADGGIGGAEEKEGTGIGGMRNRVAALDGDLVVTSPRGGPTVVFAELPCAS